VGCRLLPVAKQHVGRGRYAAVAHQLLRVGLRTLYARRLARGSERGDPGCCELVDDPGYERRLGADHDEVHLVLAGERDRITLGQAPHAVARDTSVPGRAEHLGAPRAPQQRADQRVLAAAAADDEDPGGSLVQRAAMKSSTGIAERVS
jgi:hypothetical protein